MTTEPAGDVIESPPRRRLPIAARHLENVALCVVTAAGMAADGWLYATGRYTAMVVLNAVALAWALTVLIFRPPWDDDEEGASPPTSDHA